MADADENAGESQCKTTVFWGICDIKYDPRLPPRDRVKVLELGDGRSSRFSYHGAPIKEKFDREYRMDAEPIKRAVLVDNKKFTHDTFVNCGFEHLRPVLFCYPRRYEQGLADRIARDLGASMEDAVVLKLCNRARGAGVMVCPIKELDETLRLFLVPPSGAELDQWLKENTEKALDCDFSKQLLGEQKLHYWSNECPLFVVERLCTSQPVAMQESRPGEVFDGTMRVSFALRNSPKLDGYSIDWLGGYWKLPPLAAAGGGSLEELRGRIVSSFNSDEKLTTPVPEEHLREIYEALAPALPKVFYAGTFGAQAILKSYPEDPHFRAFALSRVAAAMRCVDMTKASFLFEQAQKLVKAPGHNDERDLPERSVLSYVARGMGSSAALQGDWAKASKFFKEAVTLLPTNSSAHYLLGISFQEGGKYNEAAKCHLRSIALDPDFRSPCISLGACQSALGRHEDAIDAAEVCLRRQPDAPVAQHVIGQAIYQMLRSGWRGLETQAEELRRSGAKALEIAKQGMPQLWTESDEAVLQYFYTRGAGARERLPKQALKSWKNYAWRP